MKEFVTTMNNVYNKSYRAGEILPDWFKLERGDILVGILQILVIKQEHLMLQRIMEFLFQTLNS